MRRRRTHASSGSSWALLSFLGLSWAVMGLSTSVRGRRTPASSGFVLGFLRLGLFWACQLLCVGAVLQPHLGSSWAFFVLGCFGLVNFCAWAQYSSLIWALLGSLGLVDFCDSHLGVPFEAQKRRRQWHSSNMLICLDL